MQIPQSVRPSKFCFITYLALYPISAVVFPLTLKFISRQSRVARCSILAILNPQHLVWHLICTSVFLFPLRLGELLKQVGSPMQILLENLLQILSDQRPGAGGQIGPKELFLCVRVHFWKEKLNEIVSDMRPIYGLNIRCMGVSNFLSGIIIHIWFSANVRFVPLLKHHTTLSLLYAWWFPTEKIISERNFSAPERQPSERRRATSPFLTKRPQDVSIALPCSRRPTRALTNPAGRWRHLLQEEENRERLKERSF